MLPCPTESYTLKNSVFAGETSLLFVRSLVKHLVLSVKKLLIMNTQMWENWKHSHKG
jgi:hypothetical protein